MKAARFFLLFSTFVAAAYFLGFRTPNPSHAQPQSAGGCCSAQAPREFDFAYYSVETGFNSELYVVNAAEQPTDLTIGIFSQHGTPIFSNITVQPSAKFPIDLRSFLTAQGADVGGEFPQGSVAVYFQGTTMPVAAQLTVTNPLLRLVQESEMVENDPGRTDIPGVLNGLWWNLAPSRDATLAVANVSSTSVTADVFLDYQGQRHTGAPLTFNPHELKVLSVIQLLAQQNTPPSQAPEGGITIVQRSPGPKLIAQGSMLDPVTGFSTTLYFPPPDLEVASALHATGIPIGTPSQDSPFVGMGNFIPHVVLRNLTAAPQTATVNVEYPSASGWDLTEGRSSSTSGSPSSGNSTPNPGDLTAQLSLGPLTVPAYTTQDLPLASVVALVAQPVPYISIRVQYSGAPGSMMAEVSSVAREGHGHRCHGL